MECYVFTISLVIFFHFLFETMARPFDLLFDLIPIWAITLYDSSIQFIRRKLHISPVGVSSLLLIRVGTSQVSVYHHSSDASVHCFIYDLPKLGRFL